MVDQVLNCPGQRTFTLLGYWCHSNASDRIVEQGLAVPGSVQVDQSHSEHPWVPLAVSVALCCLRFCVCSYVYACMFLMPFARASDLELNPAVLFLQAQLISGACAHPGVFCDWEQPPALQLLLLQRAGACAGAAPAHRDPWHSQPPCQCHHHPQRHWWGGGQQIQTCQVGFPLSCTGLCWAQLTHQGEWGIQCESWADSEELHKTEYSPSHLYVVVPVVNLSFICVRS